MGMQVKKDRIPFFPGWILLMALFFAGIVPVLRFLENPDQMYGNEPASAQEVQLMKESQMVTVQETVPVDSSEREAEKDVEIALTFDDGPHPVWTEKLLDGLKARGIRATFFVIGQSAERYPELIQRMVDEGNQVGNHTYSHVQLTACNESSALEEIRRTQEVIYQAAGFDARYIRPPFGSWNETLQEETSLEAVLWDVDPYDWKVQNTDAVVQSILKQTEDGSIILLHDVYETSVEAALKTADIFLERGYRFCTVDEIMIE